MLQKLAQEQLAEVGIIAGNVYSHGGIADKNQGRATGKTGLAKVAFDLKDK